MAIRQMKRHGWTCGNVGAMREPALDEWNDVLEPWEMNEVNQVMLVQMENEEVARCGQMNGR